MAKTWSKSRSAALAAGLALALVAQGCSGSSALLDSLQQSSQQGIPAGAPVSIAIPAGSNVMSVTVNGSQCGNQNYQYANEPCVSVTICTPGTGNCQTIPNILLDTGSYGLRIFGSVITVPLNPVTSGGGTLADCVQFGDGSSEWGQVEMASVQLGGEPMATVPIHVVDSTYSTAPAACGSDQSTPDTGPTETGFNGILGVGLFAQDCGAGCTTNANNGQYFSCTGATCTASTASLANQVSNPISALPIDNNGVILELPSVGQGGVLSATGALLLGIGTQANNQPGSVTTYAADSNGDLSTVFSAYSMSSVTGFIDSGSSALFIPTPTDGSLPDCGSTDTSLTGLYCPTSTMSYSATNSGANSGATGSASFTVGNAYDLLSSPNYVFSDLAASSGATASFDWGLPFFYGRSVIVGLENTGSSLGTGPYWAY